MILTHSFKLSRLRLSRHLKDATKCYNSDEASKKNEQQFVYEKGGRSFLDTFATKDNTFLDLNRYNPLKLTSQRLREWKERVIRESEIFNQRYIQERNDILGNDLAAAHFIIYRGGKAKFKGHEHWISMDLDSDNCKDLPNKYNKEYVLEALDCSKTKICYEGLTNFANLDKVKWLSFQNCPNVDDWFVDRISSQFYQQLEYLDLSDCKNVTERAITCIYRFKNLKKLILNNIVNNKTFEFSCLLLEEEYPNLVIEGVQFIKLE